MTIETNKNIYTRYSGLPTRKKGAYDMRKKLFVLILAASMVLQLIGFAPISAAETTNQYQVHADFNDGYGTVISAFTFMDIPAGQAPADLPDIVDLHALGLIPENITSDAIQDVIGIFTHGVQLVPQGGMWRASFGDGKLFLTDVTVGILVVYEAPDGILYGRVAGLVPNKGDEGLFLGTESGGTLNMWAKTGSVPIIGTADLYITKSVVGTNTDRLFRFVLTIGGVPYNDAAEIITADPPGTQPITIPVTGEFFLRDGQTLKVTEIPEGTSYSVEETDVPAYFTTLVNGAAGKSTSGVMDADGETVEFTNGYEAEGTELGHSGTKELTGRDLEDGEFEFVLYSASFANGIWTEIDDIDTETNLSGSFTFDAIPYNETGTFYYLVKETPDTATGGVSYDDTVFGIKVVVTDDGEGQLEAAATYYTVGDEDEETDGIAFTNVYSASGSIALEVNKDLAGRTLTAGEFTFELWEIEGEAALEIVTNLADGTVTFGEIVYTEADVGTHYYMIVEQQGSEAGILYDPMAVFAVVEVTDNGDGTLAAAVEYTADVEFNNRYQNPDLSLVKTAQNLTTGGPAVDGAVVTSVVGDLILYTVTVRNEGNMPLYDAVLTDDLVLAGSAVEIDGVATVWLAGTPYAYVELGTLAVGQEVVLEYEYTVTDADAQVGIRVNTAAVDANALMAEYVEPEEQLMAASEGDEADPRVSAYIVPLHAEDDAIVTAEDIPLVGTPSIQLEKDVRNLTQNGSFGQAAGGKPGDVFEYRIVVTNTGALWLADVLVHDDRAVVGSAVTVNGTAAVWGLGADGKAVVNIGGLAPNAKATLVYSYTSVDADVDLARVNTAVAEAVVPELVGTGMPSTVTSESDTAMILVDKIPEAGEAGTWTRGIGGAALLIAGTAGVVAIRRRKRDGEESEA